MPTEVIKPRPLQQFMRELCPRCGMWSDHLFYPDSVVRNSKKEILSFVVVCGWSGCGASREVQRKDDFR